MRKALLVCVLGIAPLTASAEYIGGSDFAVGYWSGAAYTNEIGNEAGWFSHCAVSAPFMSGDYLYFSVNADVTVSIGVESAIITQPVGTSFPVTIYVDWTAPHYGQAEVVLENFATLTFQNFEAAISALQRGQTLAIETFQGTRQFDLTDSFRALELARGCAARYYGYRPEPTLPHEEPQVSSAPQSQFDPSLLYQIATEMIAEMQVNDFRYFAQAEVAELGFHDAVFWDSNALGVVGGVMLTPAPDGGGLRTTDGGDLASLTASCDGEVATTASEVTLAAFPARELRVLCLEAAASTETLVTKVLIGDSVLYTLLLFSGDALGGGGTDRSVVSEGVALRAASYVLEAQ